MSAQTDRFWDGPVADVADEYPTHAFLVHSHSSLSQDLPPIVDSNGSTRQKRRRTSPQDHAVLEAAYLKNSKPDKSERADIVSRVTLGEKEVQIWFQNRRQNDRRRSRPLLPHELVPHFRNDVPKEILAQSVSRSEHTASELLPSSTDPALERPASAQSFHSHVSIHDLLNPTSSSEDRIASSSELERSGDSASQATPPSPPEALELSQATSTPASRRLSAGQTGSGRKRAHEEISGSESQEHDRTEVAVKSAIVRLSMTADGAVKVKTTLEDTPSPPKVRAPPPPVVARVNKGLQRSKSAIEGATLSGGQVHDQSTPAMFDRNFGRSRDARTWEFYCDSNAREALSSHAETERSGSAVGAINLIRSQSQKSKKQILTRQPTRGNTRVGAIDVLSTKPKLSRTKSSMARLQGSNEDSSHQAAKIGKPGLIRSPSGDSDKENWAPGTQHSTHPSRRTQSSVGRRGVLQESDIARESRRIGVGASTERGPRRSAVLEQENIFQPGLVSLEKEKEKDKGEDLDCIQGLLSLSQGAWK